MKRIAILGSTGSIGRQTLQVIAEHPDEYEAYILTANTSCDLLIEQARAYKPEIVVIADETLYDKVSSSLSDLPIKVYGGSQALCEVVTDSHVDTVVTAMVGFAGLRPTVAAIRAGKTIALANKETLVVAGGLINSLVAEHHVSVLPVDSEHSAIFQCLQGEPSEPEKLILTASGGPFRHHTAEQLATVTSAQALRHPNWQMGAKITIDSATMMNKGFEVIEARWLFGMRAEDIEVVIHPQSVIHSAVQWADGAIKAQLGVPDMRVPIQYALSYPHRLPSSFDRLSLTEVGTLTFEAPDTNRFPCLALAYESLRRGGNMACIVNAANEVANQAFREGRCGFMDIARTIERAMSECSFIQEPDLDSLFATDSEARRLAEEALAKS